ncbi:hypothetical protein D3C85_724450 [compost metagenome]
MEDSKYLWVAELQDAKGNELEYHSVDMDPEFYEGRAAWNRAHRSWYWFRQRERSNLSCNRDAKCKAAFACSWMQSDHPYLTALKPTITHHKTIWDLYEAIGYDYKTKRYDRSMKIIGIDPGSECNMVETTFEGGVPVKVRSITSNHGSAFIIDPKEEAKVDNEVKRMRGDTPGLMHLDESGFMNKDGQQILVASGNGRHEYVVEVEGQIIPMEADQYPTAGLAAQVDADIVAQLDAQGTCVHGKENAHGDMCWDCDDARAARKGGNVIQNIAQNIADKVNAEPDVEAKKRLLNAELKHYASEEERLADAARIRSLVKMPGDRRNDPRVIAHKRGVVKAHQKLKRQQAKKERLKALQLSAFNGK